MRRIQRKRTKGWKMPPNAVYVGRPTKWGNPYGLDKNLDANCSIYRQGIIDQYKIWLLNRLEINPHFLDELRGKDLACWCPLDKPCHADVILKILEK